ncbi:MAG TPA: sugar phosphate nucleotidyltransferase [Solirubrobacteraceae bacterium]|nr:sugar phosphate nucleotidyltransferase [Solirubrobacteraceae bacterium]
MTPPVVILCGGRGTRLQADVPDLPKPLVEVGGRPILWHVIQIYASQGLRRFLLATGYKAELIQDFVERETWPEGVTVACVDTGLDTPTGGRIAKLGRAPGLGLAEGTFLATYADGVADVDLARLRTFHARHGRLASMTVVRPHLQFGVANINGSDEIVGFDEKPRSEHWINGGFFAFEPGALDYLTDSSTLEREPLEGLAQDRQLRAFRHTGFWDCMDTYKDAVLLNDLWEQGRAPWKVWG